MTAPALSLVLPVFDEASVLEANVATLVRQAEGRDEPFELVAVDDGSRDDSPRILAELARSDPRIRVERLGSNQGKGAAVRHGMLAAGGTRVVFLDADLSVGVEELGSLLAALETHPVAIGSRRVPGAHITRHQPFVRETLGRAFTAMTRLLVAPGIHDFTCGFKGFRREAARAVFSRVTQTRWAFDAEVIVIAQELGLEIAQVPVRWRHEDGSKVRVGNAVASSLRELATIRANKRRGIYAR